MFKAIDNGEFDDPIWVANLLHNFAEYYFQALQAFDSQPEKSPAIWQTTFNAAKRTDLQIIQHLLLGVNAHINFDLVYALKDMLQPEWKSLDDVQRSSRYRDHCHVNQVISHTIDSVQHQVIQRYNPLMNIVDVLMCRLDEWLTSRVIAAWREKVWYLAVQLLETPGRQQASSLENEIEQRALKIASQIQNRNQLLSNLTIME